MDKILISEKDVIVIQSVREDFLDFYEQALRSKIIKKPVSWSLYQTWKKWDAQERKRKIRYVKERETE